MSRVRTHIAPGVPGYTRRFGLEDHGFWTPFRYRMEDNPPGMWNDFAMDKAMSTSPLINGRFPETNTDLVNLCPLGFRDPRDNNPIDNIAGSPSNSQAATTLLARTNPSRADVSIPNFLWELREFPKLFKIEGDTLLRKAGSANLNYQFGWRPLIGDLMSLCAFNDQTRKREKELTALFSSGLRRKRLIFDGSTVSESNVGVHSNHVSITYKRKTTSAERVWGYVEWVPTTPPPSSSDAMLSLARRAVLGLQVDLVTAWEAIPWSWLIDYASNVGSYLEATRNSVGAVPTKIRIMRHRVAESLFTPLGPNSPFTSKYPTVKRYREQKSRAKASPSLSAHLPYLSMGQMSILGSIGVTRRVGKH